MTPSSPAPSKRRNQSSASVRSRVAGDRWTGGGRAARNRPPGPRPPPPRAPPPAPPPPPRPPPRTETTGDLGAPRARPAGGRGGGGEKGRFTAPCSSFPVTRRQTAGTVPPSITYSLP